ncbi:MAG: hypothetical protein WD342_12840 [Verrucomicrobiales bacterium]
MRQNPEVKTKMTVRPLLTKKEMETAASTRRSGTSADFRQQVEAHLRRPDRAARKAVSSNGQTVWVCS